MNIKAMRNVHLYLGVFFTPLLAFFLISGCWQTFGLHEPSKTSSYKPPLIIKALSQVHKDQRWSYGFKRGGPHQPKSSAPFQYLVLLMVMGLLATVILGVVMAFKYTKPTVVWLLLFAGTALPCLLLWLALFFQ